MECRSALIPVESLPQVDAHIGVVALTTPHGVIRIKLKPEWSQAGHSVFYNEIDIWDPCQICGVVVYAVMHGT